MSLTLPVCEDKTQPTKKIVFNVPAVYNKKVKIHDWQVQTLAEPIDNRDIFPPKGNLHISSYARIGSENTCTGITETQAMLSQIELKDQYKQIYPHRVLHSMQTLLPVEIEDEEVNLRDILMNPADVHSMDYRSTMTVDFRLPHPLKPRPPPPPPPMEPWLLNRRTIGYCPQDLEKRDGINTFLDDNLDIHRRVADLKSKRNEIHKFAFSDTQNSC